MSPDIVELLFNLMWAAVVVALGAIWFGRGRTARGTDGRPAIGLQLIALAMLAAILLPVISVTDDLQAAHYPAEVQRPSDRNERHTLLGNTPHSLPVAMAMLALCLRPPLQHAITYIAATDSISLHSVPFGRALWSRPPPSA